MIGAMTKTVIFLLLVAVWVFGPTTYSYANSLPGGQVRLAADEHVTKEVDIYRRDSFPAYKSKMISLCRKLEADSAPSKGNRKTDVETYREQTGPGLTEYHHEYRESSRFADPVDEKRTLELCRRLETSAPADGSINSEVHIYRETTVPK